MAKFGKRSTSTKAARKANRSKWKSEAGARSHRAPPHSAPLPQPSPEATEPDSAAPASEGLRLSRERKKPVAIYDADASPPPMISRKRPLPRSPKGAAAERRPPPPQPVPRTGVLDNDTNDTDTPLADDHQHTETVHTPRAEAGAIFDSDFEDSAVVLDWDGESNVGRRPGAQNVSSMRLELTQLEDALKLKRSETSARDDRDRRAMERAKTALGIALHEEEYRLEEVGDVSLCLKNSYAGAERIGIIGDGNCFFRSTAEGAREQLKLGGHANDSFQLAASNHLELRRRLVGVFDYFASSSCGGGSVGGVLSKDWADTARSLKRPGSYEAINEHCAIILSWLVKQPISIFSRRNGRRVEELMYSPKMASEIYGLQKVVPLSQNPIILLHQQTSPPHYDLGKRPLPRSPKGAAAERQP